MKKIKIKPIEKKCPNCHNFLIYGATEGMQGKLCPHCLSWLEVPKNEKLSKN